MLIEDGIIKNIYGSDRKKIKQLNRKYKRDKDEIKFYLSLIIILFIVILLVV